MTAEQQRAIQKGIDLIKGYLDFEKHDGCIEAIKILESITPKVESEVKSLSAEEYLNQNLDEPEDGWTHLSKEFTIQVMESFASMRVEQAKQKWAIEKAEIIKEYQDEVDALKGSLYSKED